MKLKLRSNHWIVDGRGNIVFGKGRLEILESIEKTGSINGTAKALGMSYKTVWSKIKSTEKHLKRKIVRSDRASGTRLTRTGRELLEEFRLLNQRCIRSDDRIFKKFLLKS
jgi:molybdate transport system regulatory protein